MAARPARWRRPTTPMLLMAAVGVIWGTIGVAAELIQRRSTLDPFDVNWLRTLLASPVVILLALRGRGDIATAPASRRDIATMVGLGVILIVTNLVYLLAVDQAGVAPATLVALCVPPVLIAGASALLLGERLTARGGVALGGAVGGTVLLVGWRGGDGNETFLSGIGLAFVCAAMIALHMMMARSLAGRHPPARPLAIGFTAGALALAPIAVARGVPLDLTAETWLLLVYLALGPSALAYWMYQRALRDVPASTASIVTLLEPLVAAVLAWQLFDERMGLVGWIGGAVLILSIAVLSTGGPARTVDA